jgi:hypothetical protein
MESSDSLDSLHHRMDRFYAWASALQVEFRDLKQRIGFIENNIDALDTAEEDRLLARLKAL